MRRLDTATWMLFGEDDGEDAWRMRVVASARIFDQPDRDAGLEDSESTLRSGLQFRSAAPHNSAGSEFNASFHPTVMSLPTPFIANFPRSGAVVVSLVVVAQCADGQG